MDEESYQTNGQENNGHEDPGGKIGAVLERARKERGLSLREVEQATKIRKRYLSGLEQEDFGALPDSVYVQGFLKTYANYLGLDGEELSQDLKRRRGRRRDQRQPSVGEIGKSGFDRPMLGPGGLSNAQGSRVSPTTLFTLLIAVVALIAVVGALYYVGRDTQTTAGSPESSPPASEQESAESNGGSSGGSPAENGGGNASPEAPSGGSSQGSGESGSGEEVASSGGGSVPDDSLAVTVSVEGSESWISVSSDGAVAYEQVAGPGFSETFEAEENVSLSTGNAGSLRVEVNGQDVGPVGEAGEVVIDRGFTLKDAS